MNTDLPPATLKYRYIRIGAKLCKGQAIPIVWGSHTGEIDGPWELMTESDPAGPTIIISVVEVSTDEAGTNKVRDTVNSR
jgi:hypothetical protein